MHSPLAPSGRITPYAEFVYNSSYDTSLKTSPLEALLTQDYPAPWKWAQLRDSGIFGIDVTPETEKQVQEIQDHLKTAQQCQRQYYDPEYQEVEFESGEPIYL